LTRAGARAGNVERRGAQHYADGVLKIVPNFAQGLTDIEGFSHLIVLWEFDRSVDFDLICSPPTDNQPHGVFATRSPRRPNPIGLTIVELLRREGANLQVRGVDMCRMGHRFSTSSPTCRVFRPRSFAGAGWPKPKPGQSEAFVCRNTAHPQPRSPGNVFPATCV
jgi:tRNA-Thr(GGU) m(6)t(6)A37 methyltransferase TsaA